MSERQTSTARWWRAAAVARSCCALLCALRSSAQVASYGDKQTGENSGDQLPHGPAEGRRRAASESAASAGRAVRRRDRQDGAAGRLLRQASRDSVAGLLQLPDAVLGRDGRPDGALEMVKLTPGKDFDVVVISHRSERDAGAGREEEGLLPEALRPSRDGSTAGTSSPGSSRRSTR